MEWFGGLLSPENIQGIIVIILIVLLVTGKGRKMLGNILKSRAENW